MAAEHQAVKIVKSFAVTPVVKKNLTFVMMPTQRNTIGRIDEQQYAINARSVVAAMPIQSCTDAPAIVRESTGTSASIKPS